MADQYWEKIKREILARLNIESECDKMGIQFKGAINATGWRSCLNPYKPERNASAGVNVAGSDGVLGYLCMFNNAGGIRHSISFFDLAKDFYPGMTGKDFKEVATYFADKTRVDMSDKVQEPPTPEKVEIFQKSLAKEVRKHLRETRGLNDKSIENTGSDGATSVNA
jgi:hypothetical protein